MGKIAAKLTSIKETLQWNKDALQKENGNEHL
jgi:hypothetical protein